MKEIEITMSCLLDVSGMCDEGHAIKYMTELLESSGADKCTVITLNIDSYDEK